MQQPVCRQTTHVAAIPLRRVQKRRRQQPHLRHGEWLDLDRRVLSRELDRILEGQDAIHRALAFLLRLQAGIGIRCTRGLLLRLSAVAATGVAASNAGKLTAAQGRS